MAESIDRSIDGIKNIHQKNYEKEKKNIAFFQNSSLPVNDGWQIVYT